MTSHEYTNMMFSPDEFAHLRIPLEYILSATDNFSNQYICGKDAFVTYYEGKLLWSDELINIYAGRLNKERFDGEQQFWMEVSVLSSLKHKNLVSFVGFCDDYDEKVIIYKRETRRSLSYYLSDSLLLTWVRRLEISVGMAQALSYIHYDESRDFSVIHCNIKSSLIYLNDVWEPKLGDFIYSMKIKASERHNSFNTDKVWSTDGYTDPTYIETKSAHHKSDMYSFGILMFELLCGRKSKIDDEDNKYLAPLAITHYREKLLHDLIDPVLLKQMDPESFNVFVETAFDCLNEDRSQRPNIDDIVTRLEKALKLQLERENVEHSVVAAEVEGTSFNHEKIISSLQDDLAHLKIPLESILSATNNFAEENIICTYGFCKEYKGQLLWSGDLIDINARRLNKERDDEIEQQFWMEISMLSSLKHKNLVSLVGFCDEHDEKIIINKNETRGMLGNYLSDPMRLTWVRRLEICVGLGQALSYIHFHEPRDYSVIHRNITSPTVVLNDGWEPKLCDFEKSMRIETSQRHHSFLTNKLQYVNGYGDPTYIKTNYVNHKSDMYSFGIVLFELLCGRRSIIDDQDNKYLAPTAIFHYKKKLLHDLIDPVLLKQMDPESFNVFVETAYDCLNEDRSQRPNIDDIVTRLEKALELQLERENVEHSVAAAEVKGTSFNHEKGSVTIAFIGNESQVSKNKDPSLLKLSYQDLESATNNFDEENFLNKDRTIFKGRLLRSEQSIDFVGKLYSFCLKKDASKKFWVERSMLSSLKHKNLVSLIGVYDEHHNSKIIIYKREANRSLENYLSDQTLTWMQRLKICVGVGNALSYIHYDAGRDFSVIHCNVRSSKILLDDKWEPKLSGFELSLKNTIAQRHRFFLTHDVIENVYLDPQYKKTGGLTHKSDVYSFGVVLFEVLCGMSAIDEGEGKDKDKDEDEDKEEEDDDELGEGLLSKLAKYHLDEMIMPHIRKQMSPESFKMFSETAYYCIKEDRADRPYIDQVVKRLKKALELQRKHENPVNLTSSNQFEVRIVINLLDLLI